MGDIGTGQLTKMVNQICFAGLIQALAEGINFAQKSGLDVEKALNVAVMVQHLHGKWSIVTLPCCKMNIIMALPSIGCVKI